LRAGARLLGKTRTDELAYSLEGRNFHEGAPLNPAAPERLTGGSSSGAASAVAAGAVDFAVASDTAGSVRVPAAWCGLYGIRPTHGRVPVAGLMPLAPSFDSVGWLARSSSLLRSVGEVLLPDSAPLRGADPPEGAVAPPSRCTLVWDPSLDNFAPSLETAALRQAMQRCAAPLQGVRELSLGIDLAGATECLRVLQGHEAWRTHGAWIESQNPTFGPAVAQRFAVARALSADQVERAARERADIIARMDAVLPAGLILCLPTVPGPAPQRDATADQLQLQRTQLLPLTVLASLTGRPQITLPLLQVDGAPVGVSLLGWRDGDATLLRIAELVAPS
jgi:amidase